MSNYDAGHYFLTLLAPIRRGHSTGGRHSGLSHVTALRLDLRALQTARQDSATADAGQDSPFAKVPGVHFARFFILDQLPYNGRRPTNAVYNLVMNIDLVEAEPVDQFENAWLVLAIDMDAADGSQTSLRDCSDRLWQGMEPELRQIFGHCLEFDSDRIRDGSDWFAYLRRCQVTTTMPFNDYRIDDPPPAPLLRYMLVAALAIVMLAGAGLWSGWWPFGWVGLAATAVLAWVIATVGLVLKLGTTPFPAAPDSDLASVLKALHVQRGFSRLALAQQGADPQALHAAFGAFIDSHAPASTGAPTQPPGRLPARAVDAPGP